MKRSRRNKKRLQPALNSKTYKNYYTRLHSNRRFYNQVRPLLSRSVKPESRKFRRIVREMDIPQKRKPSLNPNKFSLQVQKSYHFEQALDLRRKKACMSRKIRRQVMFATSKNGSIGGRRKWKNDSYLKCAR